MIQINITSGTPEEEVREVRELIEPHNTVFERLDALEQDVNELKGLLNDTGWKNLTLENGVEAYSTNQRPQYRKIGKVVFIRGAVKNILAKDTVIATLPDGFRPSNSIPYVQNTSMRTGNFAMYSRMIVNNSGAIKIEGITDGAAYGDKWFPIACSFTID